MDDREAAQTLLPTVFKENLNDLAVKLLDKERNDEQLLKHLAPYQGKKIPTMGQNNPKVSQNHPRAERL